MAARTRLDLFGCYLADDRETAVQELDDLAGDADGFLVQAPNEQPAVRDVLAALLGAPLFCCGFALFAVLLYGPLFLRYNRDFRHAGLVAIDGVTADDDPRVEGVGDRVDAMTSRFGVRFAIANWLGVAAVAAAGPRAALATAVFAILAWFVTVRARDGLGRSAGIAALLAAIAGFVGLVVVGLASPWLVLAGIAAFLYGSVRTAGDRTAALVDRCEAVLEAEDYRNPVLVAERGLLGSIARRAAGRSFEVGTVHVREWGEAGETHSDPAPADLPSAAGAAGESTAPEIVPPEDRGVLDERALAAVADGVLAVGVGLLWTLAVALYAREVAPAVATIERAAWFVAAGTAVTPLAYHAVLEGRTGTTPGKDGQDLVVVRGDGGPIDRRAALRRNLLRPIDGLVCYAVGWLAATLDGRERRLGDRVAGTVVAKTASAAAEEGDAAAPDASAAASADEGESDRRAAKTTGEGGARDGASTAVATGDGSETERDGTDGRGEDGPDESDRSSAVAVDDPDAGFDPWEDDR